MAAGFAFAPGAATPSLRPATTLAGLMQRMARGGRSSAAAALAKPGVAQDSQAGCAVAMVAEQTGATEHAEMRLIARGDQGAFARLTDREAPRLLRYARGILGSLEEAEDVVQETLLVLWQGAERWTPEARIGTWMHRVCYNRCIDRLRRRKPSVDDSALDGMPDGSPPADRRLVLDEMARSVRDAVEGLPARQRSAVLLFHFQDLPQSEAAAVMGVSDSAFESLLARARRQLRRQLDDAGGDHA